MPELTNSPADDLAEYPDGTEATASGEDSPLCARPRIPVDQRRNIKLEVLLNEEDFRKLDYIQSKTGLGLSPIARFAINLEYERISNLALHSQLTASYRTGLIPESSFDPDKNEKD